MDDKNNRTKKKTDDSWKSFKSHFNKQIAFIKVGIKRRAMDCGYLVLGEEEENAFGSPDNELGKAFE